MKSTLLIADDDVGYRETVRRFLEPEFTVVSAVGDGIALVEAAQTHRPDVIVTDISMPALNGIWAARRLSAEQDARIIFLTVHEDPVFFSEARKAGARGYVLKRCAPSDLIPAIRAVLEGSPFACPTPIQGN